jgi:multiple sugar transport system substrate-binding protein
LLIRKNEFEKKYNDFLAELKGEIQSGNIRPGEFILPENTLSQKYGLSRVTIRKALAELVDDGLIEKIPGKGNRVPETFEVTRQTLRVGWFDTSYELDIIREVFKRFEAKHQQVKIELELYPPLGYAATMMAQLEQGVAPDLLVLSDTHFREFSEKDKLGFIEGYVPPHIKIKKDYYANIFDMFSQNGSPLAAPILFSPVVVCYNKKIFEQKKINMKKPLKTWNELLDIAKKSTTFDSRTGVAEQYGFCFSSSPNRWPAFLLQNEGSFIDEERKRFNFANPLNIEALTFCQDLMYRHHVSPIFTHGSNMLAENIFMKEKAAMILTTYYFMNEFRSHNIEWDVFPLPGKENASTLLLGSALGISKNSNLSPIAKKLVDYMLSTEVQTLFKKKGCTIPVLRVVAEDNELLEKGIHPENYNMFTENLEHAKSVKDLHLTQSEIDSLTLELSLLWANMESPEDACIRIENLLNNQIAAKVT